MRINQLNLNSFGHFDQKNIELDSKKHIHVIYGSNEAGKSTLHTFIRAMLFGLDTRSEAFSLIDSMNSYGKLFLSLNNHKYCIERDGKFGEKSTRISQMNSSGLADVKGNRLAELGIDISPQLFQNIYGFNHQQLQLLNTLQTDEVNAYLFHSTLGGSQAFLHFEKELEKNRKNLFKTRAIKVENTPINQILKELETIEEQLIEYRSQYGVYQDLNQKELLTFQKIKELEKQKELLMKQKNVAQSEIEWIKNTEKLIPLENEIQKMEQQLKSQIISYTEEIMAVQYEKSRSTEVFRSLQILSHDIDQQKEQLDLELKQLGPDWTAERISTFPSTMQLRDQANQWEEDEQQIKQQVMQRKFELAQLQEKHSKQRLKLDHTLKEKESLEQQQSGEMQRGTKHSLKTWEIVIPLSTVLAAIVFYLYTFSVIPVFIFGAGTLFTISWFSMLRWRHVQKQRDVNNGTLLLQDWLRKCSQEEQECRLELDIINKHLEKLEAEITELEDQMERSAEEFTNSLLAYGFEVKLSASYLKLCLDRIDKLKTLGYQIEKSRLKKEDSRKKLVQWIDAVKDLAQKCAIAHDLSIVNGIEDSYSQAQRLIYHLVESAKQQEELVSLLKKIRTEAEQYQNKKAAVLEEVKPELPLLSDKEYLLEQINQIDIQLQYMKNQQNLLYEELGKIKAEKELIAYDGKIIELQQQHAEKVSELQVLALEWSTLTATLALIQQTKRKIEEDKQPVLLQMASKVFQDITAGKYEKVVSPFDEPEFYAQKSNGERIPSTKLSQGAKEQLYLALRIGYIMQQDQTYKLPIILDDPFVNFDRKRLCATLKAFIEHASKHQIIMFTCHEHIVQACQSMAAEVEVYHLEEQLIQA